eukprot:6961446-Pyramimonas_sp.AAC.1
MVQISTHRALQISDNTLFAYGNGIHIFSGSKYSYPKPSSSATVNLCVGVRPPCSEHRATHLTGEYTRLNDELESQKSNLKDIDEYLTNELKAKENYCAVERKTNLKYATSMTSLPTNRSSPMCGEPTKDAWRTPRSRSRSTSRAYCRIPASIITWILIGFRSPVRVHTIVRPIDTTIATADLEKQTVELEALLTKERENAAADKKRLTQEFKDREQALREELAEYEAKLKELSEFSDQKIQLEQDLMDLKARHARCTVPLGTPNQRRPMPCANNHHAYVGQSMNRTQLITSLYSPLRRSNLWRHHNTGLLTRPIIA